MKVEKIEINYQLLQEEELTSRERELLNAAERIANNAYAPYSHFKVGVAIYCADGSIFTGANMENASYPLSICAEGAALTSYRNSGNGSPIEIVAIKIKSRTGKVTQPVTPCGGCRQLLNEVEKPGCPIHFILQGDEGEILKIIGIGNLLPLSFTGDIL